MAAMCCSICGVDWPLNFSKCPQCGGSTWLDKNADPIDQAEAQHLKKRAQHDHAARNAQQSETDRLRAEFEEYYERRALRELQADLNEWGTGAVKFAKLDSSQ